MPDRPGDLTHHGEVAALLERFDLAPDKGFGQNFLVDRSALDAIVAAAELTRDDRVVEVGPGLGVLTRELAARAGRVTAIELDARLLPALEATVGAAPHVEIAQGDALRWDFAALEPGAKLVANLPYNVATPVVMRALDARVFARLVFLVQREVGERMAAGAGDDAYGALSLRVAHQGAARVVRHVAPGSFFPPPKVTSSVVRIDPHPGAAPDPELFALIEAGFRHRRKTLAKNLSMAGAPKGAARDALAELGLDPRVRAERIDLAGFRALRDALGARDALPTS